MAILLDPKGKLDDLLPPSERETDDDRILFDNPHDSNPLISEWRRSSGVFFFFVYPQRSRPATDRTHRLHVNFVIACYIGSRADADAPKSRDLMDFMVSRLDHWPEVAQYALELLVCPESNVLRGPSAQHGILLQRGKSTHLLILWTGLLSLKSTSFGLPMNTKLLLLKLHTKLEINQIRVMMLYLSQAKCKW